MASFCTSHEFGFATELLNNAFSGAAQLTVGARIELGVELVRHALADLSTDKQRTEVLNALGHRMMLAMQNGGVVPPAARPAFPENVVAAYQH